MFEFSFMLSCFVLHLSHKTLSVVAVHVLIHPDKHWTNTIVNSDSYRLSAIILFSDTV